MKYIRFQNRGFVLFEEAQSHAEIARMKPERASP